jgi:hypothetical protein
MKTCTCGKHYETIPPEAKYLNDGSEFSGYYWNCECKTTLFVPLNKEVPK